MSKALKKAKKHMAPVNPAPATIKRIEMLPLFTDTTCGPERRSFSWDSIYKLWRKINKIYTNKKHTRNTENQTWQKRPHPCCTPHTLILLKQWYNTNINTRGECVSRECVYLGHFVETIHQSRNLVRWR